MFTINHKYVSLNADLSATLKAWDKSEVGMLRVIVNEMVHTIDTGDYRNLKKILVHVKGRKAVFGTVKAIIKAGVDKAIIVGVNDEGVTVSLAKKVGERVFNETNMKRLCDARDTDTIGLFNNAMLTSVGIGVGPPDAVFDATALAKACLSVVKRAMKADMDVELVLQGVREAYAAANKADVKADAESETSSIEHKGLVAVG